MDNDTRGFFGLFAAVIIFVMIAVGFAAVVSSAFNLAWMPWQIKMQTGIIRNSNSYITTQQAALRQFRASYDDAGTDGQRAAIVRQMREIADTIPDDVQPDIRSFLSNH